MLNPENDIAQNHSKILMPYNTECLTQVTCYSFIYLTPNVELVYWSFMYSQKSNLADTYDYQ